MLIVATLVVVGALVGTASFYALRRWPALDPGAPSGAVRAVGEQVRDAPQGFLRRRLDPETKTGLALTVALAIVVLGGGLLAALAFVVRSNPTTVRIDRGVATWAGTNATDLSTAVLRVVTQLGSSIGVVVLAVIVVALATRYAPSATHRRDTQAAIALLATVLIGQNLISNLLKYAVDRARPSIHPLAGFSGPSFPSGHATAAFASMCAFAVVLGRGRGARRQATLLSVALGVATMVGASRVLLGVHWLTDVVAGAALGLAWFSLCSIAFGGRLLRFGAPVIAGERAAHLAEVVDAGGASAPAPPGRQERMSVASSAREPTRS